MSDVLQTAYKYHHKLKAELAKVEEFLRFGVELSKGGGAESYSQLTNATAKSTPSEDRTEAPPRPSVDRTAANESQTASAPEKNERKSLFRGALEPSESERIKDVA
jgi:hypothetical protein